MDADRKILTIHWRDKTLNIEAPLSLKSAITKIKDNLSDLPEQFSLYFANSCDGQTPILTQDDYVQLLASQRIAVEIKPARNSKLFAKFEKVNNDGSSEIIEILDEDSVIIKQPSGASLKYEEADSSYKAFSPARYSNKHKEQEEPLNGEQEMVECMACRGVEEDGKCKECEGTGKMSAALHEYFQDKILEASRIAAQSKTVLAESVKSILKSSVYRGDIKNCSTCKREIEPGEVVYICRVCAGDSICEQCEYGEEHPHALIKVITKGKKRRAEIILVDTVSDEVEPNKELYRVFTVKNIGRKTWPSFASIVPTEGDAYKAVSTIIGTLEPGQSTDVVLRLMAPNKEGKHSQAYKLVIDKEGFEETINITMNVKSGLSRSDVVRSAFDSLKESGELPKKMEKNFMKLLEISDRNPKKLLKMLKKQNNNLNAVFDELYS
eukprot:TRINITY_DN1739_c0_g1_i5.p1 TRINITY_DN1739_c0_g1~~TRINITY_DN1739_c0_g1_i5.p1  ORF type:complete len:438 (-),score=112.94 TRINITY_DN1739_c0_g1_i5:161-1474(-)